MEQKTKKYCNSVVKQLGDLVHKTRQEGKTLGFTEDEVRHVWKTIFEIMIDKMNGNE